MPSILVYRQPGRTLALCLLAAGLLSAPAAAQQPPAVAKPAPAPVAPSPVAAAPSPAHLAAARDLVVATGISRSFAAVVPQLMDQLGTSLTQTRPELIRDLNAVMVELKPEFDKQADLMIDSAARVYAGLMTEQEIKTADAFFTSDVGRKYVNAQPPFMQSMVSLMQNWQQQVSAFMVERVRAEMRKKGHQL